MPQPPLNIITRAGAYPPGSAFKKIMLSALAVNCLGAGQPLLAQALHKPALKPGPVVNISHRLQTNQTTRVQHAQLMPSVSDSYFPTSRFYQMASVPFVAWPSQSGALRVELIAQRFNRHRYPLTNLPTVGMAYDISCQTAANSDYNQHALGLGASWQIAPHTTINSLISTAAVPGYGDQQLVVGLQVKF